MLSGDGKEIGSHPDGDALKSKDCDEAKCSVLDEV